MLNFTELFISFFASIAPLKCFAYFYFSRKVDLSRIQIEKKNTFYQKDFLLISNKPVEAILTRETVATSINS